MIEVEDAKRLFSREGFLADDVKRRDADPSLGSPSILARTTTLTVYPSRAQSYFACQPLSLLGVEVEGGAGAVTPQSDPFFALNVGSTSPPVGAQVLTTFVGNRWVFRFDA
jgi:hypothetical protein